MAGTLRKIIEPVFHDHAEPIAALVNLSQLLDDTGSISFLPFIMAKLRIDTAHTQDKQSGKTCGNDCPRGSPITHLFPVHADDWTEERRQNEPAAGAHDHR